MRTNSIFIDLKNEKHVKWWNEVASNLVKVVNYAYIDETATGKHAGIILKIKGIHKNRVIKENLKFINNPKTVKIRA